MSIAYHLLAHKNPSQVRRLLRAIDHPDDVVVIHFDRRSPADMHAIAREWAATHPRTIVQRPREILWGGRQIVETQVEAIRLALKHDPAWTHFIILSGQDFPLKSRSAILEDIRAQPAASFIDWFDPFATGQWSNLSARVERWHLHSPLLERFLKIPGLGRRVRKLLGWQNRSPYIPFLRRKPPAFKYWGGSNFVTLSRAACEYLTSDPAALKIYEWLLPSGIPDESLFQSVLLNSPLAPTLVLGKRHYLEFTSDTPHPFTFKIGDFSRLIATNAWFARKFDEATDAAVLDKLEQRIARS